MIYDQLGFNLDPNNFTLFEAVPSGLDDPFGYKGRKVIMEQLTVSEEVQKYIRGDVEDINTDAIEKTARKAGLITLEQKGILACLRGETTLDEISRVI